MNLVITKDSLLKYFDLLTPKQKNEKEKLLLSLVERQGNKLKISSELLEILEKYFESKGSHYIQFFHTFITNSNSENRLITFKNSDSENENEALSKCLHYDYQDYSFIIAVQDNTYLKENHPYQSAIIDQLKKPNNHWVITNLAAGFTLDIDHSHFVNENAIKNFITLLPRLSRKIKKIEIIDSYFNTGRNNIIYASLLNSKSKVKCYTRLQNGENQEFKRQKIKEFFGPKKTSVFFTRDTALSHPRKISLGNLVIELTHDFTQVHPRNRNWGFYLKICHQKRRNFEDNILNYN